METAVYSGITFPIHMLMGMNLLELAACTHHEQIKQFNPSGPFLTGLRLREFLARQQQR
jgi:hypothetical protein